MSDDHHPGPSCEAIEALRATGRTAAAAEGRPGLFGVDRGPALTTGDILALALRLGLMTGPERVQ